MVLTLMAFDQVVREENDVLTRNCKAYPQHYMFANNAVSLLYTAVEGYAESRQMFGLYWAQIAMCCSLATLSTLRQHRTQAYAMLRHGLEHACLAAYALAEPDNTYFSKDWTEADHEGFLKRTVYPWIKKTYSGNSDEIERVKRHINADHAHATIVHANRNVTVTGELSVNLDFFDKVTPEAMQADLIHIGYVAMLALNLLREVNADVHRVRVRDGVDQEYRSLLKLGGPLVSNAS